MHGNIQTDSVDTAHGHTRLKINGVLSGWNVKQKLQELNSKAQQQFDVTQVHISQKRNTSSAEPAMSHWHRRQSQLPKRKLEEQTELHHTAPECLHESEKQGDMSLHTCPAAPISKNCAWGTNDMRESQFHPWASSPAPIGKSAEDGEVRNCRRCCRSLVYF